MANLAEKHDEEHSAQLADAEISRILSAMQKAEFKRSETGNARPDQTFKPRSLMEIAKTARQQDEAAKAAHEADEAIDDIVDDLAAESIDAPTGERSPDTTGDDHSHEQQSDGMTDHESQDTTLQMPPIDSNVPELQDLPVPNAGVGEDAKFDSGTDNGVGPSPTSPFETAQTAYDRGYADGVVAGREAAEAELRTTIEAEFESKLADKINAFETALTALAKPQTADINSLSISLQAAVVRLAAARTGMAIDELPELLVTRIEKLADAAGKNVSTADVYLHPDDCAVIAPIMAERQCPVKIEADPQLYRGDIRIRFDGMDICDVADLRAEWKISKQITDRSSANAGLSQTKISGEEQEIQTSDNLSEDLQTTSSQSNITPSSPTHAENGKQLSDNIDKIEEASPSQAIDLMPLTTTGSESSVPDEGAEESEEASASNPIGLMPLTSKNIDE